MNHFLKYSFSFFCLLACSACDDDGIDILDIEIPEGYALSAGTSTIFLNSSVAYDTPADWITGAYDVRFTRGDRLYDDVRTSNNGHGGGLGPVYAGYSCGSCHRNAGRTKPSLWTEGGSGSYGFSSMLVYISRKNGAFFQADGEAYTLCKPNYTISEWYAEEIKPEDLFCTVRIPLRHVGMGQMMALDPVEIEALAAKSNYPEYGISGRCNYITERGVRSLGLSGNKAQHADLTVELGFSSDMGVTNSRYPEEICEGQIQVNQGSMMGLSYDQLDVSTEEMENVDLYMQSLGVPARRNVNDPQVIKGEQNFYKAKCHLCHVTTLHTKTRGSVLLNNTQLPWLGGQTIHPYSDYRTERQLCKRAGTWKRMAYYPSLGNRLTRKGQRTYLFLA